MAASNIVALAHGIPTGLVSLGTGLVGVALARWVFVGRENRRLSIPQKWNDALPLTLVAMLITGVIIHDQQLGLSAAAFTGLGVGWAAVLLLDILGERIVAALRAGFAMPVPPAVTRADVSGHDGDMVGQADLPPELTAPLAELDKLPPTRASGWRRRRESGGPGAGAPDA